MCPRGPNAKYELHCTPAVLPQNAFMQGMISGMDADDWVERYAWYAPITTGQWLGELVEAFSHCSLACV